jgi:S1-C subfamily serine protease
MPADESEDERAGGPPPDPSDRAWVHPSELTAFVPRSRPVWGRPRWAALAVGIAVVAAVAGVVVAVNLGETGRSPQPAARSTGVQQIASAVAPSVVAIRLTGGGQTRNESGVCLQPGQIVTSAHALEGATAISVVTSDGHTVPAAEVGRDPVSDLALLAVDEASVRSAELGASDGLAVGQRVVGVASSTSGRHRWVDAGQIESFNRSFVWGDGVAVPGLIETDMTAGEEHSGGALVDSQGAVVGILVVPPDASTAGFSLPIDQARDVAAQLLAGGRARHGWLGVLAADATDRAGGGARVQGVVTGSPADRAGLAQGDVIVAFRVGTSTTAISSMAQLMAEVGRRKPGERLDLTLYREGGKRHLAVRLGDQMDATSTTTSAAAPGDAP